MKRVDAIVVGSGISGLTATLLLALHGRQVVLVEKAPRIGGSLGRFQRQGIPFDTGFHFTGGLSPSGLLHRMLTVLGMADTIVPRPLSNRFVFESAGRVFDLPAGIANARAALQREFPGERAAVEGYFDKVAQVCANTASMDLRCLGAPLKAIDEEFVTLKSVLDALTGDALLKGVLSALSMCYGVKSSEVSFASHSRVCYDLYESVAGIVDGGDALVRAFEARFAHLPVEIRCGRHLVACGDIHDDRVGRFVLDDGEAIAADTAVLTIHPRQVLDVLPRQHVSRAFVSRVESFEPSAGFFSVYGVLDGEPAGATSASTILSLFPQTDVDALLDPACTNDPALVVVRGREQTADGPREVVTTFEPSFPEHVAAWRDSVTGHRPPGYEAYKQARVEAIRRHIGRFDPALRDRLRVLDAASVLTFRDYLHSPDGSAYGIKQKVGQHNLIGKLPLRNLYVAGQSAMLPGLAGAMMASFIAVRSVMGKEAFGTFIGQRLCH